MRGRGPLDLPSRGRSNVRTARSAAAGETAPFRLIQHKHEAWWFYRYLSQVYDHIVNPGHWTVDMREDALEPALLHVAAKRRLSPLKVIDVGGGTGFSTTGIVEAGVPAENVTLVDQSPRQVPRGPPRRRRHGRPPRVGRRPLRPRDGTRGRGGRVT